MLRAIVLIALCAVALGAATPAAAISAPPPVSFACWNDGDTLLKLVANATPQLAAMNASVILALDQMTPARATAVQRWNTAGVEVAAWLLMPVAEGDWINENNAHLFPARYDAFRAWQAANNLTFSMGIGLDLEFSLTELKLVEKALRTGNWSAVLPWIERDERLDFYLAARANLSSVIARAKRDGFRVISFLLPPILDERAVGSTALQRLTGIIDVPQVDVEALMSYDVYYGTNTTVRAINGGVLYSYMNTLAARGDGGAQTGVGLGCTRDSAARNGATWDEMRAGMLWARARVPNALVGYYDLAGAVAEGWLPKIAAFDWGAPPPPAPANATALVDAARAELRAILEQSCRNHPSTCNLPPP